MDMDCLVAYNGQYLLLRSRFMRAYVNEIVLVRNIYSVSIY